MNEALLADAAEREAALDVTDSYAVQAPAGSGKTELLTLRFLKLLALVEEPEAVLAITFTRKAASEMANRILGTLQQAAALEAEGDFSGLSPHDQDRYAAAIQVLARDRELQWQLLDNPARLRIQTIDSFCAYLAGRLPLLSGLGAGAQVDEDNSEIYLEAVRNTLEELKGNSALVAHLSVLLLHLDNDLGQVETLLVELLGSRDQWLANLLEIRESPERARESLQAALEELIAESIEPVRDALFDAQDELLDVALYAGGNLRDESQETGLFNALEQFPGTGIIDLAWWQDIADMLLVQDLRAPAFRRKVDKRNGFPAGNKGKEYKDRFTALVETLAEIPGLLHALSYLRRIPDSGYMEEQWRIIQSLTHVLPFLIAQLNVSFGRHGKIDYTQQAIAAIDALGHPQRPSDLGLALDYQIQHILVDEFQDTSTRQNLLLERLTEGWQADDGRTLFIVGDGMQSCYAFRNANVGLFVAAREKGLGNLEPVPLDLGTNFRSNATVVEWVNGIFRHAFPGQSNISRGAVTYTEASAYSTITAQQAISARIITYEEDCKDAAQQLEAEQVLAHIQHIRAQHPGDDIAILVRARTHLPAIVNMLRQTEINWQATDIDRLRSLPVIEDMLSLTRALANPADRLAWLAMLRAPWCGLLVADLHAVAMAARDSSIWHCLQDLDLIAGVSGDGSERLRSLRDILSLAMNTGSQLPLSQRVFSSWSMLGGEGVYPTLQDRDSSRRFIEILEEFEQKQVNTEMSLFESMLDAAFVPNPRAGEEENPVQIMTVHKAKGLEFDHVILPGLSRGKPPDRHGLMRWYERVNNSGQERLFLAVRGARGQNSDPMYELLRYEQEQRFALEDTRLMYIAVTRARQSALLLATLQQRDELKPPERSLLATIWPQLRQWSELEIMPLAETSTPAQDAEADPCLLRRLSNPLPVPDLPQVETEASAEDETLSANISGSEQQLRAAQGILVHRALQALTEHGAALLQEPELTNMRRYWRAQLGGLAMDGELEQAVAFIEQSVRQTWEAKELAWVFDHSGEHSDCELALNYMAGSAMKTLRIDRTLLDSDGRRWIIDYKSAEIHEGESQEQFRSRQLQSHGEQLRFYRDVMQQLPTERDREIRLALLLTDLPELLELN